MLDLRLKFKGLIDNLIYNSNRKGFLKTLKNNQKCLCLPAADYEATLGEVLKFSKSVRQELIA